MYTLSVNLQLTVKIPCHKPASLLKSNTQTITSAVEKYKYHHFTMSENKKQRL